MPRKKPEPLPQWHDYWKDMGCGLLIAIMAGVGWLIVLFTAAAVLGG